MSLRIALQMDSLERLNKESDSTLYLAHAALRRGYELFSYEPKNLSLTIAEGQCHITAKGHALNYAETWSLGEEQTLDLKIFDILLMRQDPPFDLAYITATHILEHLKNHVRIINDPVGVRNAPEKLLVTQFPHLMPPTLIARDAKAIEAFRAQHKDIILKPLHGHGGHGIFHLRPEDDNLNALLEMLGEKNGEPWMIQKYLPINQLGDKRIILLNGKPVGQFIRLPAAGDARSNLRVGGHAEAAPLTKRDQEICETLAPTLREHGLYLVGLDVIGDALTEINVTSPTGLVTADKLEGRRGQDTIAERFWDGVKG